MQLVLVKIYDDDVDACRVQELAKLISSGYVAGGAKVMVTDLGTDESFTADPHN